MIVFSLYLYFWVIKSLKNLGHTQHQTLELSCVRISCCTLSFSSHYTDIENDCGLQQAETSQMAHAPYWANCIRQNSHVPKYIKKSCIRTTHLNTELQWHFSLRVKPTCSICSICWASHYIYCQASLELLHCNNSHIPWQSVWNRAWQKCVCVCLCVALREKFNSNIAERWGWGDEAGLVNLTFISLWNSLCV